MAADHPRHAAHPRRNAPYGCILRDRGADAAIGALAARQHGVVARRQLVALGLGRGAIARRLERERLRRLHRGVYAVGHAALTGRGRWMAAVLAAGPRAALSHRSAAALWGIRPTASAKVDVVGGRPGRLHSGVVVHEARPEPDEITADDGIPVTIVPRTLLDFAAVLPRDRVERAMAAAEAQRLWHRLSLTELVARHPRARGAHVIRAILADERRVTGATRSEMEDLLLALAGEVGLPPPEVNAHLRAGDRLIECDCVWRSARLIVELDSRAHHSDRAAFEDDRERDRALQVAGWRVVRVTWRQLTAKRRDVAADLRDLLSPAGVARIGSPLR